MKLSSKIFVLKVKGQGQTVIIVVRDTLSHHYTTTYQISLTYLKRQKVIAQTQTLKKYQLFDLKVKGQTEVTMKHDTPSHDNTRYTYIPNIINLS
jgi:hypothetical protein